VLGVGRVLVGVRARDPWAGYAEFPGGKVLPGETPEAAVRREVLEECGVRVRVTELLARVPGEGVDLHFFLCALEDPADGARPAPPFRWVPVEELSSLRFPTPNAAALARVAELA
jgi:mutator protein MutT